MKSITAFIKESHNAVEPIKTTVKEYHKENGLQRLAYENQEMKNKVKEVAQFADLVADVAKSEGRDNYVPFYHHLASDIFQMLNLWGFLDDED